MAAAGTIQTDILKIKSYRWDRHSKCIFRTFKSHRNK